MLSSVAVNSLSEMVSPCLTPLTLDADYPTLFVQMYCYRAARIYVFHDLYVHSHLLFLVLAMMSILLGFERSQIPSRNPRMQHTVECCIHGTSL